MPPQRHSALEGNECAVGEAKAIGGAPRREAREIGAPLFLTKPVTDITGSRIGEVDVAPCTARTHDL
jgi:hypothetical protein